MSADVIVTAAGRSTRFGGAVAKQYLPLAGAPVLAHSLRRFGSHPAIDGIVVVVADEEEYHRRLGAAAPLDKVRAVVRGGAHRQESVRRGLEAVTADLVLVHDAVRPLVGDDLIDAVIEAATVHGAAVPVIPVSDTPKLLRPDGGVEATLERDRVGLAQTPQGFSTELLRRAHRAAEGDGIGATDDAALVERLGLPVATVPGRPDNLKITAPGDLRRAERWLGGAAGGALRTGIGFDQHPLRKNRRLVLGGVEIEHGSGLEGHSDADVLVHAVCDALLGAAALDDIGAWFPDTDPAHRGASSLEFLRQVGGRLAAVGLRPIHLDVTLVAEAPLVAPHRDAMRARLAAALDCPVGAISVKASRAGGIGALGRGEGMAAFCVALVGGRD